jgi:hypothetical protein
MADLGGKRTRTDLGLAAAASGGAALAQLTATAGKANNFRRIPPAADAAERLTGLGTGTK